MALASQITGNTEIIQVAEAVAREKGIQREAVVEAIEQAIQVAARKKYGYEQNIKVEIDRKSGETKVFRERTVVEKLTENTEEEGGEAGSSGGKIVEILLADAKRIKKDIELGESLREDLPPMDIGRVA